MRKGFLVRGVFAFVAILSFSTTVLSQSKVIRIGRPSESTPDVVSLKGTIVDTDGEALDAVVVLINGINQGQSTDEAGNFQFTLPPGLYTIILHRVGLNRLIKVVDIHKDGEVVIEMSYKADVLDQVTIAADRDANVRGSIAGVQRLGIQEIERLPAFLGEVDVVKSLQLLPGISTVGEGAGGFNVRGGKTDQNLVLLEHGQIFNASHVLGFFSSFNPSVVEDFVLYKGYIPAQYGGRISSVLRVNMKEGSQEKIGVEGGIGVISSNLAINGPIGEKTTFVAAGRASYSDWVLRTVDDIDIKNSEASFSDLNGSITHRFNQNHKIKGSAFRSKDYFLFSDQFGFEWSTLLFSGGYEGFFSPTVKGETDFSWGRYESSRFDPEGVDAAKVENGIDYLQFTQNFLLTPLERHTINVGVEFNQYENQPERSSPQTPESGIVPESVRKENGREYSVYINDEYEINDLLTVNLGLRYTYFQNFGPYDVFLYQNPDMPTLATIVDTLTFADGETIQTYDGFEPRLGLRFNVTHTSSIKVSYTRLYQYLHTVSNTTAQTPIDLWQMSNRYIPPQNAHNFSIGYFQNFKNNLWEFSLDAYYRQSENLLEYKDFVELLLNNHLETDLLSGDGRAYGAELLLKKNRGKWSGWLSYTYARSLLKIDNEIPELRINRGDWYPINFDRPHNLTVVSQLKMGKRSSFDANFTYTSGRPTNAIVSAYQIGVQPVAHFSERNQFRIPDYIRLDLAITAADPIWKFERKKPKKYEESVTFSIYNVLGRNNAYSVFFVRPEGTTGLPVAHQFSVLGNALPAITYNIKF